MLAFLASLNFFPSFICSFVKSWLINILLPASEAQFDSTWILSLWEWNVARMGLVGLRAWAILIEVIPILELRNSLMIVDVSLFGWVSCIPVITILFVLWALSLSSSTL